ncbi:NAD(P)/FAD-dependent oxidoreductase [Qipengyuania vesicularis]|uniref:NAD(P)/FAD-dependent oxidoreductase n=1 Tax=Qipengyuania vesicularis TaxID=2867232 RepID=UPI001C8737D8|nr:FAD-binding oxidoreductase [Qipengyuania vesicularis]MBX7527203.1 FAD-binding oxidoreductase [Qipengyuania vesicularis]
MAHYDFIVIGAGIAGLSAAARLAKHGSTLVIEAESAPGFHSSGRSAAFAHYDMASPMVRALTAASMPLLTEPAAHEHPALFIAAKGEEAALAGLFDAYREWAPEVERLTADEARKLVPVLREDWLSGAILDRRAKKLDAHAMLEGHRKQLLESGGTLDCGNEVIALRQEGSRWVVETRNDHHSAGTIVNAAGAWADHIARLAGIAPLGLQPLRRTVITYDVAGALNVSGWPFTKTVGPDLYFEAEGQGRLLACPMDEGPSQPCDAQPDEEDIALAAWRVEQITTLEVRRLAGKWAGLRSFLPDRQPVAGFDGAASGFFWLAGQGGFGLQTSPAMALATEALVARLDWPDALEAVGVSKQSLSPERLA